MLFKIRELCLGCSCLEGTNLSCITELSDKRLGTSQLKHNGPAIKGGCVAEWMEAGAVLCHLGRVLVPAGRSEAWCGFCRPVASFLSFTSVTVQGLLGAGHLSPYTDLVESSGAVTVMSPYTVFSWEQERFAKTVTSLITFIVRVSFSIF